MYQCRPFVTTLLSLSITYRSTSLCFQNGLSTNTHTLSLSFSHTHTHTGGEWNHGNGNIPGGDLAARRNAIVVSMNYRLGQFGFLPFAQHEGETLTTTGNWGHLDQRAALQWIQDNIRAFGGDPERVLLFGESAGAGAVMMHLIMTGSAGKGLFHSAVSESGPIRTYTLAEGLQTTNTILNATGCKQSGGGDDEIACLRNLTTKQLMEASATKSLKWAPVVDGVELPKKPLTMLAEGTVSFDGLKSVVAGVNTNEGSVFIDPSLVGANASVIEGYIRENFPDFLGTNASNAQLAEADALYPFADGFQSAANFYSDGVFVMGTRAMLNEMAKQGLCLSLMCSWVVYHIFSYPIFFVSIYTLSLSLS